MTAKASLRRVLVVDDDHDVADSMALLLKLVGHEVGVAYDAGGAVTAIRTFHPEVVLLDIGMPRVTGYDIARQLRDEASRGKLKVIAVTGYVNKEYEQRAYEAGCDGFLAKPARIDELEALLTPVE
jgi:CheY-like chemotaxis protein